MVAQWYQKVYIRMAGTVKQVLPDNVYPKCAGTLFYDSVSRWWIGPCWVYPDGGNLSWSQVLVGGIQMAGTSLGHRSLLGGIQMAGTSLGHRSLLVVSRWREPQCCQEISWRFQQAVTGFENSDINVTSGQNIAIKANI